MESNGLKNTDEISPLPSPNSNKTKSNDARRKRQRIKKLQKQNPLYDDILSSSDEDTYATDERKLKRRKSNEKSKPTTETENNSPKKSKSISTKSTPVDQLKPKKSTTPKYTELGVTTQPETSENVQNQQPATKSGPSKSKTTSEKTKKTMKNEVQSASTAIDKITTPGAIPTDVNEFISQLVTKQEQQPQLLKDNKLAQRKMQNITNSRK